MKIVHYIISVICISFLVVITVLTGSNYFYEEYDQVTEIVFFALCFISSVGLLSFILQFFWKRFGYTLAYIFYGSIAGIMGTNIISEIFHGCKYYTFLEMITEYLLMISLFLVAIFEIFLIQAIQKKQIITAKNIIGNKSDTKNSQEMLGKGEKSEETSENSEKGKENVGK